MGLFSAYAVLGITTHPGAVPAPQQVGAVAEWLFFPVVAVLACAFLLFPTGTLRSRRWRPVVVLNFLATGLLMIVFILVPRRWPCRPRAVYSLTYQNPFGVPAVGRALAGTPIDNFNSLTLLSLLFLAAGALSLVLRYRAGGGELRRQINWVALAGRRLCPRPAGGDRRHRGRPRQAAAHHRRRLCRVRFHRPARLPGRDHDRDPEVPAVRDRRHHQPGRRLRPGLGRADRRVRRDRAGHRDARRAAGQPATDDRRGRRGRPAVPARPAAGPPGRQPAGVRGAGHALPGAVRLRR